MSTDRLEREREFHDRTFGDDSRSAASRFYSIEAPNRSFYEDFLAEHAQGDVLEYGCGPGSLAFFLAERGAQVTGIDISPVAIEQSREKAEALGVAENTRFEVMNAEALEFPPGTFDLVCGTGILHHLELEAAFAQLAKVLKPDGQAIFIEPLGHNPLINLYRLLTPKMRTEDEHPLLSPDLDVTQRWFGRTDLRYFHLTTLLAVPARGRKRFGPLVKTLNRFDDAVFRRVPLARKHAWIVGMVLSEPRPPAA
jgi:SAM-dependent methyltransferase